MAQQSGNKLSEIKRETTRWQNLNLKRKEETNDKYRLRV